MIDANRLERLDPPNAPESSTYKVRTALVAPDGRHYPAGSYFTVDDSLGFELEADAGSPGELLLVSSPFGEFALVRDGASLPDGREVLGRVVAVCPPRRPA